jgi:hypothetical protein
VLLGLMLYALVNFSSYILPADFCAYLFSGVAARAAYSAQRRRKRRLGPDDLRSDVLKADQVRFDSPEHHRDDELPLPRPASDDEKIVTTTATHSATHSHDAPSHH